MKLLRSWVGTEDISSKYHLLQCAVSYSAAIVSILWLTMNCNHSIYADTNHLMSGQCAPIKIFVKSYRMMKVLLYRKNISQIPFPQRLCIIGTFGLFGSLYFLGLLLGCTIFPRMSDLYGRHLLFICGNTLHVVTGTVIILSHDLKLSFAMMFF